MLNVFPNLLTYDLFAPLLLRMMVGCFLVWWSYKSLILPIGVTPKITSISKTISISFIVLGILLVIGLYTQLVALFIVIIVLITLVYKWHIKKMMSHTDIVMCLFVLAISLSLMVSGPGFYAIDLPL